MWHRVDHHCAPSGASFGPNEISIFCPRMAWTLQAERDFFRYKPSKLVISRWYIDKPVIYCWFPERALQQLSDWWECQNNFTNTAGTDSKISQSPSFSFMRRVTSMHRFSDAWASHTTNHLCKNQPLHFARIWESEKLKLDQFYSTQIKLQCTFYLSSLVRVVGPNLEIPFCSQPCSVQKKHSLIGVPGLNFNCSGAVFSGATLHSAHY